jgi:peptide/nickel transport system substrate-binding protein
MWTRFSTTTRRSCSGSTTSPVVHQIQQIIRDRVLAIPLFEQAFIWGIGPRVAEAGDGRIPGFGYSAPFEDLQPKN